MKIGLKKEQEKQRKHFHYFDKFTKIKGFHVQLCFMKMNKLIIEKQKQKRMEAKFFSTKFKPV